MLFLQQPGLISGHGTPRAPRPRAPPGGLMADGRFSIDPREGMMLFSAAKRGGSGLGSADWRAGDVSRDDRPGRF